MLRSYQPDDLQSINKKNRRENFMWGFIGHNRTGKTSIAAKYACEWKKSRPEGMVIAFDPQDYFKSINVLVNDVDSPLIDKEIYLYEIDSWYETVIKYKNVLLILDDYRTLHEKNIPDKGWYKLLALRNQRNIDIIWITHTPALILNILTAYTTHYFIFYTMTRKKGFEEKIPHYQLCMAASMYINKYVTQFGKGDYPNFPYIVVDTQNEELISQNIDQKLLRVPKKIKTN